jgi:hypothetical protein
MLALQQVLWCAGAQASLQFHAPTLVGPGSGYASNFNAITPSVFVGTASRRGLCKPSLRL